MQCVDYLKDASRILTVVALPLDFLLMAENIVAHDWSSALAWLSIESTNLVLFLPGMCASGENHNLFSVEKFHILEAILLAIASFTFCTTHINVTNGS